MAPTPNCHLCGGNAGRLGPHGAHELCAARAALGLPTPNLGDRCGACNGVGCIPRSAVGPMLFFDGGSPGRDARAIAAWAPKCSACGGRGYVDYAPLLRDSAR